MQDYQVFFYLTLLTTEFTFTFVCDFRFPVMVENEKDFLKRCQKSFLTVHLHLLKCLAETPQNISRYLKINYFTLNVIIKYINIYVYCIDHMKHGTRLCLLCFD